jgi:predicted Zn-dependent peptidase
MQKRECVHIRLLLALALCCLTGGAAHGRPPAGDGFRLPPYEKITLENGLTVFLLEQHEVPLISVSAVFPAGAVRDGERHGLASLTADALLFGTKSYTKAEIEDTLEYLGVTYETSATPDLSKLSMSFMSSETAKVLPLLKEIIADPVFDAADLDKRKTRLLAELEQVKEHPSRVISAYFHEFLFEEHPYGNPVMGTKGGVSPLTARDVREFYEAHYLPSGSAVAFAGDFRTADMREKIEELFSGWRPAGAPVEPSDGALPAQEATGVLLVNKEDATETRFMIGGFGITWDDPDYVEVEVVNTILGGRFTSWLNDELRINSGLTYGAFSYFEPYGRSGIFAMSSFTGTGTTIEAIDLALEVLGRLHAKGIDGETLDSAKNYMKGQFPPRFETAGQLASLLTIMFTYGLSDTFINDFEKEVEGMTPERATEIIAEHFPKDNLRFVLIGKASEIRDAVKKYGELTEKEITADGF